LTADPLLLIRADAGPAIGLGHAMRCLAIAQAWGRSGAPRLWAHVDPLPPALAERLREEGVALVALDSPRGSAEEAARLAALATERGASWMLVDGYRFEAPYASVLADSTSRVAWLDDGGRAGALDVDLVVNPNVAIRPEWYAGRATRTRLLLGSAYALLRREFVATPRAGRATSTAVRRIIVTMGGSDADDATAAVLRALDAAGLEEPLVRVVVGPANAHARALRAAARPGLEVMESVGDMRSALEWADLVVTGAGGTVWEALYLGVPAAVLIVAEDQRGNAVELDRLGVSRLVGEGARPEERRLAEAIRALSRDPEARRTMAARGRALVDGRGTSRVVAAMREADIAVRTAGPDDGTLLFRWANDPMARAASFSPAPIAWDDHVQWLRSRLSDPASAVFVGSFGGEPLGTVRFAASEGSAVISTTVDPSWRNRGYGGALIRAACRTYFAAGAATEVEAYVKEDNEASRRAFLAAGFDERGPCDRGGARARRLVLARSAAA
jgi:UDP-2,4-diacetamido-2,4,6-trideoxy-beta-L-altropyranose hydrolase